MANRRGFPCLFLCLFSCGIIGCSVTLPNGKTYDYPADLVEAVSARPDGVRKRSVLDDDFRNVRLNVPESVSAGASLAAASRVTAGASPEAEARAEGMKRMNQLVAKCGRFFLVNRSVFVSDRFYEYTRARITLRNVTGEADTLNGIQYHFLLTQSFGGASRTFDSYNWSEWADTLSDSADRVEIELRKRNGKWEMEDCCGVKSVSCSSVDP